VLSGSVVRPASRGGRGSWRFFPWSCEPHRITTKGSDASVGSFQPTISSKSADAGTAAGHCAADGADDVGAIPKNGSHGRKADKLGRDKAHGHIRCNHSHRMAGNNHHWPGNRPASIKASPRKTVKSAGASDTPFDPFGSGRCNHAPMSAAGRDQGIFMMSAGSAA
jgi:hypothetical protein